MCFSQLEVDGWRDFQLSIAVERFVRLRPLAEPSESSPPTPAPEGLGSCCCRRDVLSVAPPVVLPTGAEIGTGPLLVEEEIDAANEEVSCSRLSSVSKKGSLNSSSLGASSDMPISPTSGAPPQRGFVSHHSDSPGGGSVRPSRDRFSAMLSINPISRRKLARSPWPTASWASSGRWNTIWLVHWRPSKGPSRTPFRAAWLSLGYRYTLPVWSNGIKRLWSLSFGSVRGRSILHRKAKAIVSTKANTASSRYRGGISLPVPMRRPV